MKQEVESGGNGTGLKGKRVVILGGTSGIGLEVARQAFAKNAETVVVSSNASRVQQAVESFDREAEGHTVDLLNESAIADFFGKLGKFDHLVYTAGDTLQLNEVAAADLKKARQAFELRYWSVLAAVKYGSGQIRKDGSIVLTTGIAGARPRKGWVFGAGVCGAVEAMTRALAVELAPLRVNAVCPGVVRTNLWQNMGEAERGAMFENVGKNLLVGRVGEANEVARAYIFLMEEGFSTGQIVVVDGGTLLV
jgi:NAD(P)-dependent dehydrogenase (short-subunit alcohol dehydrogenase family)